MKKTALYSYFPYLIHNHDSSNSFKSFSSSFIHIIKYLIYHFNLNYKLVKFVWFSKHVSIADKDL